MWCDCLNFGQCLLLCFSFSITTFLYLQNATERKLDKQEIKQQAVIQRWVIYWRRVHSAWKQRAEVDLSIDFGSFDTGQSKNNTFVSMRMKTVRACLIRKVFGFDSSNCEILWTDSNRISQWKRFFKLKWKSANLEVSFNIMFT
jgi:hypothetical protein